MKKILKYTGIALMATSLLTTGCTDAFETMNTNPNGITDEDLKQDNNYIGTHYIQMLESVYFNKGNGNWEFQLIQNLNADIYSGYMASGSPFAQANNNMHYALNHGWNDYCWDYAYGQVMSTNAQVIKKCDEDPEKYYDFQAVNTIVRVLTMSRVSDMYGPIIYSHYGEENTGGVYDKAEDAYKRFFEELKEASAALKKAIDNGKNSFEAFDITSCQGSMEKWAKFANSLRLRLAMRLVNYDPAWAKQEAEAAIADANGLILSNDDNFEIWSSTKTNPTTELWRNPLGTLAPMDAWHDILLNANLSSILSGYGDGRLEKMAVPNKDGKYVGIRNGMIFNHSKFKDGPESATLNFTPSSHATLFCAAETNFLLAEAALRGWNAGGDAKSFYEAGIKASFAQWGAAVGDYLTSTNKPADFVDLLDPACNIAAVETATPSWDDAANNEDRFRKICVQKWIAIFPEGINGWAEVRRTDYPKLFPVMRNDSQGEISTEDGVRRLPFTIPERDNNTNYNTAVGYLNGPDTGATRIFWDVTPKPTF